MDGCHTKFIKGVIDFLTENFPYLGLTEGHLDQWNSWQCIPDKKAGQLAFDYILSPGFFRNLEAYEGSINAHKIMVQLGHDVRICTTPLPGENRERCKREKTEWVEEHLGSAAAEKIIFSDDKTQVKADVIVDDKPHLTHEKEKILFRDWIIVDHPYNRSLPNTQHLPIGRVLNDWSNWKEVFSLAGLLGS